MKCPFCAEEISRDSKKCDFCKEQFVKSEKNYESKTDDDTKYHCTACKETVHKDAQICKHCGVRLTPNTVSSIVHETVSEGIDFIWKVILTIAVLFFLMWGCVALM